MSDVGDLRPVAGGSLFIPYTGTVTKCTVCPEVIRWRCECGHTWEEEGWPDQCPSCEYYHCGDYECCNGPGFELVCDE